MQKKFLQLNDIGIYKLSYNLSNYVWKIVVEWDHFSKSSVGIQYVKVVDSVSANIAEGFGRYSKKDKVKFYRYSFGSLKESMDWTQKAKARSLISDKQYEIIMGELLRFPREIYSLINFTNEKLSI